MGVCDGGLVRNTMSAALAKDASQRLGEFNGHGGSPTPHGACATVSHSGETLCAALAEAAKQRLGEFTAQEFREQSSAEVEGEGALPTSATLKMALALRPPSQSVARAALWRGSSALSFWRWTSCERRPW